MSSAVNEMDLQEALEINLELWRRYMARALKYEERQDYDLAGQAMRLAKAHHIAIDALLERIDARAGSGSNNVKSI